MHRTQSSPLESDIFQLLSLSQCLLDAVTFPRSFVDSRKALRYPFRTTLVVSIYQVTFLPRRRTLIVQQPRASLPTWCARIELR